MLQMMFGSHVVAYANKGVTLVKLETRNLRKWGKEGGRWCCARGGDTEEHGNRNGSVSVPLHSSSSSSSSSLDGQHAAARPITPSLLNMLQNLNGNLFNSSSSFVENVEAGIECAIFNSRFLTLMGVCGSLIGAFVCFLKGCLYVFKSFGDFYKIFFIDVPHEKMVLHLVEAIDVYLTGTVMLLFGVGLYGLFISNVPDGLQGSKDRALQNSSFFGMFMLKKRPRWMQIGSLSELKSKLGHVILMSLLVNMFEKSKLLTIATTIDLLVYCMSILLASASLYVLHKLHQ